MDSKGASSTSSARMVASASVQSAPSKQTKARNNAKQPSSSQPGNVSGRQLLLIIMKQGVAGLARLVARGLLALGGILHAAMQAAWLRRATLLGPLALIPPALSKVLGLLRSTKAGQLFLAALSGIMCLQLYYTSTASSAKEGAKRRSTGGTFMAKLSLLFGAVK
jgi:hypothetical protein